MNERNIVSLTFEAGADLSGNQATFAAAAANEGFRRFVSLDANGKLAQANAADTDIVGVCQGRGAVGVALPVANSGIVKVLAGSAVAIGEPVGSDANGLANTAVAAGDVIQGTALTAAAQAGDMILVLLRQRTAHAVLT